MPKIEWDNSFSVHNAEIDGQHKKWIEIFNKMHEILTEGGDKVLHSAGAEALKAMQDYSRYHFNFEEEYMRTINYPDLYIHKRMHKDFDNQIYTYGRDMQEGKIVLDTEIIKLIKDWLLYHILNEDKKYVLFFEKEK